MKKSLGGLFAGLLLVFCIGGIVLPSAGSAVKGRQGQTKPAFSWKALWTGSFLEDFEEWWSARTFCREGLSSLAASVDTITGRHEENGIYKGKSKQLFEEIQSTEQEDYQQNAQAILNFANKYWEAPMSVLIVPDAAQVLHHQLPANVKTADQSEMLDGLEEELGDLVTCIDVESALEKHMNEKLYYQTDYHLTSLGAYYAFQAAAESLEIDSSGLKEFASYTVTTDFNGALAQRSGFLKSVKETIDIYIPGEETKVVVSCPEDGTKRTSLFDSSMLDTEDPYQVFLGGEKSLLDIRTTADASRRLLLIGDSSANAFVQFMTPYFREIVLVKPAVYEGNIDELMSQYQITDVLVLYRGNSFAENSSLSGVLQ